MAWYNENDPAIAEWLRRLIAAGHLPAGEVDDRDFRDIPPAEVGGGGERHFFAGIGGWALAGRIAGWPSDIPLWTASLPCQPFSRAGLRKGAADDRDLWVAFRGLIAEQHPPVVVGEQVAGTLGRTWCGRVRADLEADGYAFGLACLPACAVGTPHQRERMWWLAVALDSGLAPRDRRTLRHLEEARPATPPGATGEIGRIPHSDEDRLRSTARHEGRPGLSPANRPDRRMVAWPDGAATDRGHIVHCADGKARRIPSEPRFQPLADDVPARVLRLRAYGNSLVPTLAAVFLEATLEVIRPRR